MGYKQILPLRIRIDQGVMVIKRFFKALEL